MHQLDFNNVSLAFNDLHTNRRDALGAAPQPDVVLARFDGLRARFIAINAAPPAEANPFAAQLSDTNDVHDAVGRSIDGLVGAQLGHPNTSAALRADLLVIRQLFMAGPFETNASYSDQAALAKRRRELLPAHTATLQAIPTPDGRTLLEWVVEYIEAGERIEAFLQARSQGETTEGRRELRRDALRFLSELRAAVRAAAFFSDTPDLEQRIFAFIDERASS